MRDHRQFSPRVLCLLAALALFPDSLAARGGGGCFLPDTPVTMADGTSKPIVEVKAGDRVLAFGADEKLVPATIKAVYSVTAEEYLEVEAAGVVFRVTAEHPFYVGGGAFKTIGKLKAGDNIYAYDGSSVGARRIGAIRRVAGPVAVYNLSADAPNTFIASGAVVHNKGGGCVAAGTLVDTPTGKVRVERLKAGDIVTGLIDGKPAPVTVQGSFEVEAGQYREIVLADRVLSVSGEHPVQTADGEFRSASALRAGDTVVAWTEGRTDKLPILAIRTVDAAILAYNLVVSPGGVFSASGIVVHNKGCFLPDTDVAMADGTSKRISQVKIGDRILACGEGERVVPASVRAVHSVEADEYLEVSVDGALLRVTSEHPFYVGNGAFKTIGKLKAGDSVYAYDGKSIGPRRILGIKRVVGPVAVYNLTADEPNTFLAAGVVVHNKGGGGGFHGGSFRGYRGGYHGSGSYGGWDDDDWIWIIVFIVVLVIVLAVQYREERGDGNTSGGNSDIDLVLDDSVIMPRTAKTMEYIRRITETEKQFGVETLHRTAEYAFRLLQKVWHDREYAPMRELVVESLAKRHEAQLRGMVRSHEIDVIADLTVNRIDVVQVRYAPGMGIREFAALIDAQARDYYIDDRSRTFLRGDYSPKRFQEIYVFTLERGKWLLANIEQTNKSKRWRSPNLFEPAAGKTAAETETAAAEASGAAGTAAPGAEQADGSGMRREAGSPRIAAMLEKLRRKDKSWDKDAMALRASEVFTRVCMFREGDQADISSDLTQKAYAVLESERQERRTDDLRIEYRNFCVRSVRIAGFSQKRSGDQFIARIYAHAQKIVYKHDEVVQSDSDVREFAEYWTFTKENGRWVLSAFGAKRGTAA